MHQRYQKNIFKDKYEIDSFNERTNEQMQIGFEKQGYINYAYLQDTNIISTLYTIIHENIINKNNNIAPNDKLYKRIIACENHVIVKKIE